MVTVYDEFGNQTRAALPRPPEPAFLLRACNSFKVNTCETPLQVSILKTYMGKR
jgi:hypothetical protein